MNHFVLGFGRVEGGPEGDKEGSEGVVEGSVPWLSSVRRFEFIREDQRRGKSEARGERRKKGKGRE